MAIRICPKCNGKVSSTRKTCGHCGYELPMLKNCPECGEEIDFSLKECPICCYVFENDDITKKETNINSTFTHSNPSLSGSNDNGDIKNTVFEKQPLLSKEKQKIIDLSFADDTKDDDKKEKLNENKTSRITNLVLNYVSLALVAIICFLIFSTIGISDYFGESYFAYCYAFKYNVAPLILCCCEVFVLLAHTILVFFNHKNKILKLLKIILPFLCVGILIYPMTFVAGAKTDFYVSKYVTFSLIILLMVIHISQMIINIISFPKEPYKSNKTRKTIAIATTAVVFAVSLMPSIFVNQVIPPYETEIVTIGDQKGVSIKKYWGEEENVIIPGSFYGIPVTSIGSSAFSECNSLKSIAIPDSVTSIGSSAFYNCNSLINIELPSTLENIEYCAFESCNSLTSIVIPNSVTSMGQNAFYNCTSLTIWCEASSEPSGWSPNWNSNNRPVYWGTSGYKVLDGMCFSILSSKSEATLFDYTGKSKEITIPATINKNSKVYSVTSIGDYAFYNCNSLTNIELPSSLESIGDYAFFKCNSLTSIVIPDSVTSIGSSAFYNCSSLQTVTFEEGSQLESIGRYAFDECNSLTSIVIPNSVKSIGFSAFSGCSSLTSIKLPSTLESIGDYAFSGCSSLTSIELPSTLESIGDYAFFKCNSLTSIVIPDSVTSIGSFAFYNCISLISIKLPSTLERIEYCAFYYCNSLTSIVIPDSVTSIGQFAFRDCSSLENVYHNGTIEDWCNITFENYSSNPMNYATKLYFLDENGDVEYNGNKYSLLPNELVIPSSVNKIKPYAFCGCSSLTSIVIPEGVTSIGSSAFESCSSLTSIELPSTLKSIGYSAFSGCSSLTSIVIPYSVTSIGHNAFRDCIRLTIYCEASSKPSGWDSDWNSSSRPVYWAGEW